MEKFQVTPDLYASKGKRIANVFVDYFIRLVIALMVGVIIGVLSELTNIDTLYDWVVSENKIKDYIIDIIILVIYYNIIEALTGRSIGKYVTKTKIVLEDGSKPDFQQILIRTLCRLIPFDAFSFLGAEARGWHDSLSKTFVVDVEKFEAKRNANNEIDEIGLN